MTIVGKDYEGYVRAIDTKDIRHFRVSPGMELVIVFNDGESLALYGPIVKLFLERFPVEDPL